MPFMKGKNEGATFSSADKHAEERLARISPHGRITRFIIWWLEVAGKSFSNKGNLSNEVFIAP